MHTYVSQACGREVQRTMSVCRHPGSVTPVAVLRVEGGTKFRFSVAERKLLRKVSSASGVSLSGSRLDKPGSSCYGSTGAYGTIGWSVRRKRGNVSSLENAVGLLIFFFFIRLWLRVCTLLLCATTWYPATLSSVLRHLRPGAKEFSQASPFPLLGLSS